MNNVWSETKGVYVECVRISVLGLHILWEDRGDQDRLKVELSYGKDNAYNMYNYTEDVTQRVAQIFP